MRICFVGLGSIARRHIKNIKELFPSYSIDVLRHSANKNLSEDINVLVDKVYYSFDELPNGYDVMFITNPTSLHYETLRKMHNKASHFFIEKPVFEKYDEDIDRIGLREDSIYYVACPLRYSAVIQYLKENIDFSEVYSVRAISSSYLPDWRPQIDYRKTYSANKELGGGVSIDLIHEWDYIFYLIGAPLSTKCFIKRKSNLEINSDDLAIYIAEYKDKMVEVHLDYFGRETVRKVELFTKDDSIEADLIASKIIYRKSGQVIELKENRDEYQKKEIKHFFDIINGKTSNDNSIQEACEVLKTTMGK